MVRARSETPAEGCSFLLRFADDFVIGCELESDARRIMEVLPKRFDRYGLTIHPHKTKMVQFEKPPRNGIVSAGNGTFDFLGFTHYWAKSRKGNWVVKRKTAHKRLRRSIKALWRWCKRNSHLPIEEQYQVLCQKMRGHYQYYGICNNYRQLQTFYQQTERGWWYWLTRRSRRRDLEWEDFRRIMTIYPLPTPRITHAI